MMMQHFSSHHIKNSSLQKSLSKFWEGVALPSELRLFFAASQKGGIIVGLWEKVDNVYACVCVLYMCKKLSHCI